MKTISEVAAELDMTLRTLRFYEVRGLVSPKRSGVHRLYSPEDVTRLIRINQLTAYGFSLREIGAGIDPRALVRRYADLQMEIIEKQQACIDLGNEISGALGHG
jgi:DNA-binding transcriptional MerR regulator